MTGSPPPLTRRDFLKLRREPAGRVAELACEALFMWCQQASVARAEPAAASDPSLGDDEPAAVFAPLAPDTLLADVRREVAAADLVRVVGPEWLAAEPFGAAIRAVLDAARAGGARIELVASPAPPRGA